MKCHHPYKNNSVAKAEFPEKIDTTHKVAIKVTALFTGIILPILNLIGHCNDKKLLKKSSRTLEGNYMLF